MEIKIFCCGCKVEILRAETDTLRSPLIGSMFKVKKDMEWALFSPHDIGNDLLCPMCDWVFHEDGKVMVGVNGSFVTGMPELVIPGVIAHEVNASTFPDINLNGEGAPDDEMKESKNEAFSVPFEGGIYKCDNQTHLKEHGDLPMPCDLCERVEVTDPALADLQNQVEGTQLKNPLSEEESSQKTDIPVVELKKEIGPELKPAIELKKETGPEPKPYEVNTGDWSKNLETDEGSEANGTAPPGTTAVEPVVPKQPRAKKRPSWLKRKNK